VRNCVIIVLIRGGGRHFHLGGPLEGPVLQQGELSMVCVGLSERDLKNVDGAPGGDRHNLGGQWPPWNPPSSAPGSQKKCLKVIFRSTILRIVNPLIHWYGSLTQGLGVGRKIWRPRFQLRSRRISAYWFWPLCRLHLLYQGCQTCLRCSTK